jgi:secreted trypsin-like serine protease
LAATTRPSRPANPAGRINPPLYSKDTPLRRITEFVSTRRARAAVITFGLLLAGAVAVPAASAAVQPPAPNIVGGHEPTIPHEAIGSLQIDRGPDDPLHHTCSAELAPSRQWATTSAHCVTAFGSSDPLDPALFHIRFGSDSRTRGGVLVGVTQILVNAAWAWQDGPGVVGDIAVLKLDRYVDLQQWQVATRVQVGGEGWMLGWGSTEPNGDPGTSPDLLQQLETTVLPHARCVGLLIGVDQVCVNNPNGTDGACRGDSGGPILQRVPGTGTRAVPARYWVVGGLVGSISPCGSHPFVYTNWVYWRDWIYQAITTGGVPAAADGTPAHHGLVTPGRMWLDRLAVV